jgi:hypothetical protein
VIPPAGESPVVRLPFQVRPQSGEGARSFITRLAQANHLPPAYLRKFLTEPPAHRGVPSWDRLAAATGRDPAGLQQVLETIKCEECGAPMRPLASFGVKPRTCSSACRQKRYLKRVPAADWQKVPCRVCGQLVRFRLGQRRYMCSSHCRRIAFQFRQRGEPLPRPPNSRNIPDPADEDDISGVCPVCEGPMNSLTGRKGCSKRCSARIAHWTRSPLPPAVCHHCRERLLPRADGRLHRWCSTGCRGKDLRGRRTLAAAAILSGATEFELDQAGQEPVGSIGTATCRGCEQRYWPLGSNPWCSPRCLERELRERAGQGQCGGCRAPMANRRPVPGRVWCSRTCRKRAAYWRTEFRARAQLVISIGEAFPEPEQPRRPTCRGCHRNYQPIRPNPWCSDQCFEKEIITRSDQHECGACGASMAHIKLRATRRWCSGTCQQRAFRWRAELRDRAAQDGITPPSLSQTDH